MKIVNGNVRLGTGGNLDDCFFFFFQAEDGIRDLTVTGVQTCALPILVQGLGGAIMSPAALSLLTTSFQGKDRAKALGIYGSIGGAGGAAGVLFGGLLTSGPGWRWVFFVNIPLGIAIVAATPRLIRRPRPARRAGGPDLPRAVLI